MVRGARADPREISPVLKHGATARAVQRDRLRFTERGRLAPSLFVGGEPRAACVSRAPSATGS